MLGDGSGDADQDEIGLLYGRRIGGAEKLATVDAIDASHFFCYYVKSDGPQMLGESFGQRLAHIA
jgi:hypothetical protein